MKTVVIDQKSGPEVLKYEDTPRPQPKGDEMLVRGSWLLRLTLVDIAIREGLFDGSGGVLLVPGIQISWRMPPDNAE